MPPDLTTYTVKTLKLRRIEKSSNRWLMYNVGYEEERKGVADVSSWIYRWERQGVAAVVCTSKEGNSLCEIYGPYTRPCPSIQDPSDVYILQRRGVEPPMLQQEEDVMVHIQPLLFVLIVGHKIVRGPEPVGMISPAIRIREAENAGTHRDGRSGIFPAPPARYVSPSLPRPKTISGGLRNQTVNRWMIPHNHTIYTHICQSAR